MPAVAVLESQPSDTAVCVTDVECRFGGAVGRLSPVGGGGLLGGGGVEHGALAAVSEATAERFCALSAASTPNVWVAPQARLVKSPVVEDVVPTFFPSRYMPYSAIPDASVDAVQPTLTVSCVAFFTTSPVGDVGAL